MKGKMQERRERWLIVAIILIFNYKIEVPVYQLWEEVLIRSVVTAIMFAGIQVLLKLSKKASEDK